MTNAPRLNFGMVSLPYISVSAWTNCHFLSLPRFFFLSQRVSVIDTFWGRGVEGFVFGFVWSTILFRIQYQGTSFDVYAIVPWFSVYSQMPWATLFFILWIPHTDTRGSCEVKLHNLVVHSLRNFRWCMFPAPYTISPLHHHLVYYCLYIKRIS